MKILVTGGAGYIGSITVAHLLARGHEVVVLDDLSTGHREAVSDAAELVVGRVQDEALLDRTLTARVDAVIHFASLSLVSESVQRPLHYLRENLGAALSLLAGMQRHDVNRLVFSSSAAVYGAPAVEVIDEEEPLAPVNPYGHSKAMIERAIDEQARVGALGALSLRYFNACGAHAGRGEDHRPETHLIPRLCRHLLGRLDDFEVHGGDFPTPDGSAIRDYVHVADLARAHALAVEALDEPGAEALNLGTGTGASVLQVLQAAADLTGKQILPPTGAARAGDPPRLVASRQRAQARLGWTPERSDLPTVLRDAIDWHEAHPDGYGA